MLKDMQKMALFIVAKRAIFCNFGQHLLTTCVVNEKIGNLESAIRTPFPFNITATNAILAKGGGKNLFFAPQVGG